MKYSILTGLVGVAWALAPNAALAQSTPKAVSPASVLDFTQPQFDTETPHYDVSSAGEKAAGTVVADVGGRIITLGDVGDAIRALPPTVQSLPFDAIYPAVLKQLIQLQAMAVRAQKRGLDKDPVVARRVKAAADRALTNELMLREAGAAITETMLLDRYNLDYGSKPAPKEAHVRVILVATETEADALIAAMAGGADFATLARQSSRDSSSPRGGDLGFMRQDTLTPEIGAIAFTMAPGQTFSHPVKTGTGWFIVRVDERRQAALPAYAAVKEDIRGVLLREGFAAVAKAALSEVTVHAFDIAGKEVQAEVAKPP